MLARTEAVLDNSVSTARHSLQVAAQGNLLGAASHPATKKTCSSAVHKEAHGSTLAASAMPLALSVIKIKYGLIKRIVLLFPLNPASTPYAKFWDGFANRTLPSQARVRHNILFSPTILSCLLHESIDELFASLIQDFRTPERRPVCEFI
jgi:hypothetical protein